MLTDDEARAILEGRRLEATLLFERFGPNARYPMRPLTAEEKHILLRMEEAKLAVVRRVFTG